MRLKEEGGLQTCRAINTLFNSENANEEKLVKALLPPPQPRPPAPTVPGLAVADKFSRKYQNSLRLEPATAMHHYLLLM